MPYKNKRTYKITVMDCVGTEHYNPQTFLHLLLEILSDISLILPPKHSLATKSLYVLRPNGFNWLQVTLIYILVMY